MNGTDRLTVLVACARVRPGHTDTFPGWATAPCPLCGHDVWVAPSTQRACDEQGGAPCCLPCAQILAPQGFLGQVPGGADDLLAAGHPELIASDDEFATRLRRLFGGRGG